MKLKVFVIQLSGNGNHTMGLCNIKKSDNTSGLALLLISALPNFFIFYLFLCLSVVVKAVTYPGGWVAQ